ncbi:MAG: hypothetical protein LBE85_10460 [Candidatus Accumulibacter sp.]|jgi:hypothetical protein|nr:hypothetical protein [Accumulibacter sp.]
MSAIPVREHHLRGNEHGEPRVALVSFDSLGDSLIYLMVADNLRRNGFRVTLYGDVAHRMREWLPRLDIRPYPSPAIEGMETELEDYDLAIVSPPGFLRARMDEAVTARLRERLRLENVTKTPALQPPAGLLFRGHPRRIVVRPDSAGPEKKDWRRASRLPSSGF